MFYVFVNKLGIEQRKNMAVIHSAIHISCAGIRT